MFQLWEINQMEREICQYLEWELNVDPVMLREFEDIIRKDFVGPGPYPTYILPSTKKWTSPPTANPFAAPSHMSPSPSYGQQYPLPSKLVLRPPPNPTMAYMTPPTTPDTPSLSYSPTSPASSASPPSPLGIKDSFKVGDIDHSGYPTFTVNHFNGPVTHSSEGFLDRNLDSLNPDFVSLLRGSVVGAADSAEGAGSINPFIKGLFSGQVIATQAHPKNEDTIVSAQQTVKPMRIPSTRRKGTVKRLPALREDDPAEEQDHEDEEGNLSSGATPCVASSEPLWTPCSRRYQTHSPGLSSA